GPGPQPGIGAASSGGRPACSGQMVWPKSRLSATAGIWGLAAIGLIALIVFDLSPPLAFNDDWMYAWSVHRLLEGHGLQVFPESTALALVQVVWGAAFSRGHADPRL